MFDFLKNVFVGGNKNADKLVDGAVRGLDALVFTEEEKSEMSKETFKLYLDYLKATQPQNLARRYLAFIIAGIWAVLVLILAGLGVAAGVAESVPLTAASSAVNSVMGDYVFLPFSGVTAFYFVTHALRAGKK
jgi:hypothetical protein